MTKAKNQINFLDQTYHDLTELLNRYKVVLPYGQEEFKNDLFQLFVQKLKQSFKNGIEAGRKQKPARY